MNYKERLEKYSKIIAEYLEDVDIITSLKPIELFKLIEIDLMITKELEQIQ